ncbi:MAG: transcription termination factor Rho [Planctomycetota bacterium]|jgi:transcription termination factor Rho
MPDLTQGVLKREKKDQFVLRDPVRSFRSTAKDPRVPIKIVRDLGLVEGATITGKVRRNKRGFEMVNIDNVCGLPPKEFRRRTPFDDLVPIDPCERFPLAASGVTSMRIVDLIAPIGKGTRGLIVSPPKAGKTIMLEQIANAIRAQDPEVRIIVLLIDERPEEVTQFRRAVDAEVLASSNDNTVQEHVELAELTLAHIRVELECGRDVVVLLDSITRMGRAFNLRKSGSGRTMSGGVDAGALEIPRRFFGLARNIENGGSITIVATALVDTGSRMDQLIFEEFKGTGNSEIVLNRKLSEFQIYPAIDLNASGTRKEEMLYGPGETQKLAKIRRVLAERKPMDAMTALLKLMDEFPTNAEFLESIPA